MEMPVIPANRVVEIKENNQKKLEGGGGGEAQGVAGTKEVFSVVLGWIEIWPESFWPKWSFIKLVQHKLVQWQLVQRQLVQRQLVQYYKCVSSYNGNSSHEPVVEK
jgi:hypothetical protein